MYETFSDHRVLVQPMHGAPDDDLHSPMADGATGLSLLAAAVKLAYRACTRPMTMPNFFIVGAPKCGTTALSNYLRAHPHVFMCWPKEPHYFATDLPLYRYAEDWGSYLALFQQARETHGAVGEASVFYLYSKSAMPNIHSRVPDARVLVMLRNPIEVAVSMHAQALLTRDEDVVSFSQAWRLCDERRQGRYVPRHCRDHKILLYDRLPLLGSQLQRLLEVFPRSQVRWWFYDDFARSPRRVYREALAFLGLEDDGRRRFDRVNARRRARSQWLAQFTQKTPQSLVKAAMGIKGALGIRRWGVLASLRRLNFSAAPPQAMPPALARNLHAHFEQDIRLLERLTGRELGCWLEEQA